MQEIHISYSGLKSIAQRFIVHVSRETGCIGEVCISTGINDDLGVDGDDWDPIIQALVHEEGLELDGFGYYDYFSDEGASGSNPVIFFPFTVLGYLAATPRRDWSLKELRRRMFPQGTGKTLSVADLITSKIEGRFVPRSERRYVFKMKSRQLGADGRPVTEQ